MKVDKLEMAIQEVKDLRISDERKAEEKKFDKWFESLTAYQQAEIAYNFWDSATYEQKKEEYYIE